MKREDVEGKMQKRLIIAVILIISMAITGTALAASASFSDVPAKHWAYDSVNKLTKAGIIDGYGDGTFRGDKTITRYEFAIATTKALQKYDAADAANKALIDKLSVEFAIELNTLGTRITKVEKKIGTFKINGDYRYRHDYVENPTEALKWPGGTQPRQANAKVLNRDRYRLMLSNDVAPNVSFFSLLIFSGNTTGSLKVPATYTDGGFAANPSINGVVEAAFATYKAPDGTVYKFGRNFLYLGQGMLWDVPHADGVQVTFGNKLRTMVGTQDFISKTWYFTDMKYDVSPKFQLTAATLMDKDKVWYNSAALGFIYKATPDWKLSAEVGQNDNASTNVNNGRPGKLKASIATVKYGEAKRDVVGSTGVWTSYKKAEKGFDMQFGSAWVFPSPYPGGLADDLKGFEYGFEYTAFKNGTLTVRYNPLTSYDGTRNLKFLIADMVVRF